MMDTMDNVLRKLQLTSAHEEVIVNSDIHDMEMVISYLTTMRIREEKDNACQDSPVKTMLDMAMGYYGTMCEKNNTAVIEYIGQ